MLLHVTCQILILIIGLLFLFVSSKAIFFYTLILITRACDKRDPRACFQQNIESGHAVLVPVSVHHKTYT